MNLRYLKLIFLLLTDIFRFLNPLTEGSKRCQKEKEAHEWVVEFVHFKKSS